MRVMVVVKSSAESETGALPDEQALSAMNRFNEELADAGVLLALDGLKPSSKGVRVKFDGDKRTVTKGPFPEARGLIAGFWLWKVRSMDEAIEWLKKAPFDGGAEIEIREVFEIEDFGSITPELSKRLDRVRERVEAKA